MLTGLRRRVPGRLVLLGGVLLAIGCAGQTRQASAPGRAPEHRPVELFPGVRIDPAEGAVEFDAEVATDCHDPETPDVYLEVVCCGRDSREHEALVVTDVPASLIHAALLAVGAGPGAPGGWREEEGQAAPVPASGERLLVRLIVKGPDGSSVEHEPGDWIRERGSGRSLRESVPDGAWVFAGSRIRRFEGHDVYDADGTGQVVGLHTFGSETVAWTRTESPDSRVDEPRWLAWNERVPSLGTPVTVRLVRAGSAGASR